MANESEPFDEAPSTILVILSGAVDVIEHVAKNIISRECCRIHTALRLRRHLSGSPTCVGIGASDSETVFEVDKMLSPQVFEVDTHNPKKGKMTHQAVRTLSQKPGWPCLWLEPGVESAPLG